MKRILKVGLLSVSVLGLPFAGAPGPVRADTINMDAEIGVPDLLAALFRADASTPVAVPEPLLQMFEGADLVVDLANVLVLALEVNTVEPANTILSYSSECLEDADQEGRLICSLAINTAATEDGEAYESAITLNFAIQSDMSTGIRLEGEVTVQLAG